MGLNVEQLWKFINLSCFEFHCLPPSLSLAPLLDLLMQDDRKLELTDGKKIKREKERKYKKTLREEMRVLVEAIVNSMLFNY